MEKQIGFQKDKCTFMEGMTVGNVFAASLSQWE